MNPIMQLRWKCHAFEVSSEEPQLEIRPPRSTINVSATRYNPSAQDPKMREVGFLEDLTPLVLMPFGTKLLVALDQKRPVSFALPRHRREVPLIPRGRLVVIDASGHFFGARNSARSYASLVNEYDQAVENISHFFHPGHCLFGEIVSGKEGGNAHYLISLI
jgi:hypothetical protein